MPEMETVTHNTAESASTVNEAPVLKNHWFRSVLFQVAVACFVSFTAPGMWDALGGLGAGGAAKPYAVSAGNATMYSLFAVTCLIAGALNNRIGLRYALAIGAAGMPIYGAALYTNNEHPTTWFLIFGSALCGISIGFYYTSEATLMIGYPHPQDRGFYLAIWQTAKASGPIVGGAINLALNSTTDKAGSVSRTTYIVFLTIMCLGPPVAFLLSPTERVRRKDGSRILIHNEPTTKAEMKSVFSLMLTRRMILLMPAFFVSYFYLGFLSTWLTVYFTVRSRAFSSFVTNWAGVISSYLIGYLLDRQNINLRIRAKIAFSSIITVLLGTWIWVTVMQDKYNKMDKPPVWDWFTEGFNTGYPIIWFWVFGGQAFQQFCYWVVGQLSNDIASLNRHCGILRSFEAMGQAIAWGMQSTKANHFVSMGLNFGLLVFCIYPTWKVLSELEENTVVMESVQVLEQPATKEVEAAPQQHDTK
ncbi:hypothetical protein NM208_g1541 [Fusarium decemcellulare]|uniref:Uncharacterized protein n=1 Tax=Fusarium decemcellulare TaxID=57161 RepID=A0ACC1SW17_9HYPO|nr:hypothetical protein NM208_g1541 [Fusarium decemcellulare]